MTVIKKLLSLIVKSDLNKIVLLVFLLIFGMILEIISLGLLFQVLETILGEQQTYFTIF